jgi:xanthine dehydrogenase molybdopterin-binding subunit B
MQVEYEVLEAILTIEEAIKAASYIGEDAVISRGDPAAVFATGKNVVSGEVHIGGHICVYMSLLILLYVCIIVSLYYYMCVSY